MRLGRQLAWHSLVADIQAPRIGKVKGLGFSRSLRITVAMHIGHFTR